jgi:hypothetical protein
MPRRKTKGAKAGKKPNPAFEFLMNFMQKNPRAAYADAAAAGKRNGHLLYPIMWGRAQLLLGRAKPKAKKGKVGRPAGRGPGRPPRAARGGMPRGRRPARAGNGATSVTVDDPERWHAIVQAVNAGATLALSYDGKEWSLTVA